MKYNATVLYIEDDADTRRVYTDFLNRRFTSVVTAQDGKDGLEKYLKTRPELIITDIRMPDMNGPEFIQTVRKTDAKTPIIVLSAYSDEPFLTESFERMISGHITKPADHTKLAELIEKALTPKDPPKKEKSMQRTKKLSEKYIQTQNMQSHDLMVVGISASAGGLEALTALVNGLPEQNNTAYVLAQHTKPCL